MPKGKQTDTLTIYKIMLSYITTRNYSETARQLDLPESTVEKIYKENKDKPEFVKLYEQKKDEFIEKADEIIKLATQRIIKTLTEEDKIPLNQISTTLGIVCDKKSMLEKSNQPEMDIPELKVKIVDNTGLEKYLYEEDDE